MATVTTPVVAFSPAQQTPGNTVVQGTSNAGLYGTPAGAMVENVTISGGSTMTYNNTTGLGPSVNFSTSSAVTDYMGWSSLLSSQTTVWFRQDLFMAANPSAQHQLIVYCQSGTRCADISINTSGKLLARNTSGTTIFTTTNSVPLNTPFRIEGYITGDPSVGQMEIKLFPNRATATPTETQTSAATQANLGQPNQYRFGLGTGGSSGLSWDQGTIALSVNGYVGPAAVVQQMACGAPTATGFTVISKPVGGTSLRLKVATDAGLTQNVTWMPSQVPDSHGYTRHVVTGCKAFTRYYCQLYDSVDGAEVPVGLVGQCKTLPAAGLPASFKVAFASCINTGVENPSPNAAINDWIAWQPDLALFTGDYNYENPVATDVPTQLGIYEYGTAWFGTEPLIRQAWGYYCRSNHDSYENSGTQNTDDYQNTAVVANIAAAQEWAPFGTLGDTVNSPVHSLCQSWVAGRVRFIMLDDRTIDRSLTANTDIGSKTMLGNVQLQWLYNQLVQPEPLKIIVSDTAWMGLLSGAGGDLEDGKWWSYTAERSAIINFLAANAAQVQSVMFWHGDTHGLGCCPGSSNPYGGFPVYCAAPMRQTGGGYNTSTFSQFYNNSGGECRQYGRVTITDTGSQITVQFSGWDALNQVQQVTQTDVFTPSFTSAAMNIWNGTAWIPVS